ncbi:Peptidyl-prolyl cis-trans isomerase cyp5 [Heracleum sosnowskyi]|uniref:peptidylprolyl isomerase n=1 Tax=Heracleum sosnowskyi TaxID=360622 RepID=A0AAD8MKD4_9APIA|nr:Peptidyl-prolyl cis-trans isomerase cyp5 [Heracleum sosnowskyi]
MSKRNPFVFLDVSIDGDPNERMVFELFYDLVPKTAENFRALCTGEKGISSKTGKPLHYKGTFFHRIKKGSTAQVGDLLKRDGSFGESIYVEKFPDERSKLSHDEPGLLSMAKADRDTRGSLFSITFEANHDLDRKHIVFGKLVEGHDVLKKIENCGDKEGKPVTTVKITKCGEDRNENQCSDKRKASKLRNGKEVLSEANSRDLRRKKKHKRSSKDRRKRRRRYYSSDSDSSSDTDTETETSESDSESDSDLSSSSESSSSSDDKRKKRKRSKRDRHRRGKKRDKRRDKRRKRRNKRSKHKSKRALGASSGTESSTDDDSATVSEKDRKHKNPAQVTGEVNLPLLGEREDMSLYYKKVDSPDLLERDEDDYPKENGQQQSNKIEMETKSEKSAQRDPDLVDYHPGKYRSRSISPTKILSRKSFSPKTSARKSPSMSPRRSMTPSRSMSRSRSVSGSPLRVTRGSRSLSKSPIRSGSSPSRSVSRSPASLKKGRSISPIPVCTRPGQSSSRSPTSSPLQGRRSRSPLKTSSRRSSRKLESISPIRSQKSISRSPVRSSRRSISRSSGRAPSRRSASRSRSPVRENSRNGRRARSPYADRTRSITRSPSLDGLSKQRIRRGRGFSQQYSNARRYHSPDRSPARLYRYGRSERDRYPSHRRSPRRHRTPPRERSPIRYRGRRSRTRSRSRSRSPIRNRRRSHSRSRSPVEMTRYRASPQRRITRRSRSLSHSSRSESPKRASKAKSVSSSESPPAKNGLVSYGDGSPDSGER